MSIPPLEPSGELRVSMLLRLTSDLFEVVPMYPASTTPGRSEANMDEGDEGDEDSEDLLSNSGGSAGSESVAPRTTRYPLVELYELLYELDNAWAAVISCQVWNHELKKGEDVIISVPIPEDDVKAISPGAQKQLQSPQEEDTMDIDKSFTPISPLNDDDSKSSKDLDIQLYAPTKTDCTRLRSMIISGMSAIEDWLDEANAPDAAKQPFEDCFDMTLRLLGEDSNEAIWEPDGFISCGVTQSKQN
jgi:hypothetical protein